MHVRGWLLSAGVRVQQEGSLRGAVHALLVIGASEDERRAESLGIGVVAQSRISWIILRAVATTASFGSGWPLPFAIRARKLSLM
jgi:hypothetical protein